ncbi:MAG: SOS response-associated peptidase [Corynebacterium sp.]|nr:SOS response-associated peptidase [Corynebacterium sp.]
MCGRMTLFNISESLAKPPGLPAASLTDGLPPARYNIAPTQPIAAYIPEANSGGQPQLRAVRWGLRPHWKKDDSGPVLFNARAETVRAKPSFRDAFQTGRCLIACDGYYEWSNRQPYWISTTERMWFAGLYAGDTATIITTASVGQLEQLHHRMPRILEPSEMPLWLGDATSAADLLVPVDVAAFDWEFREVSTQVNSASNEGPELLEAAVVTEPPQLF